MKSFAAILVLALTAMAGAQPDRDYDRYRYNDQNAREHAAARRMGRARNGDADALRTEWINVGHDVGRFSQLRIVATTAASRCAA